VLVDLALPPILAGKTIWVENLVQGDLGNMGRVFVLAKIESLRRASTPCDS